MLRGVDEHGAKKRSFDFTLVYIKCFRTYSVYLSLRLPAQILYAGIHLCPLAVNRSCFGYSLSHLRTAAACLSRCIRHRRRSKAKPLRGRRGRSRAVRISLGEHKEPRLVRIFAPCGYFHENLYKKQPAAFQKNTKRKQRAVRSWVFGENVRHDSAKDAGFSPTYG